MKFTYKIIKGLALALSLFLLVPIAMASDKLTAEEALKLSSSGEIILVDIRRPEEWRKTGLASTAVPISIHTSGGWKSFAENLRQAVGDDLNKPVALICASGVRSRRALKYLGNKGYTHLYDVSEGMLGRSYSKPGWIAKELPLKNCGEACVE